jgi:hypothetical protein
MPTFEQVYEPVAGSLVLSTLVAAIPIAVLFVLLAGFRVAAHWSSLASLALALVIAARIGPNARKGGSFICGDYWTGVRQNYR